ncbi:MAG: hypothetical protein NC402_07995 [Prevotella sp.]|nr:hypothetical protein [Prevotella sp.]MCM1075676.1 hypothetical protein [Ruminococcus sp.]
MRITKMTVGVKSHLTVILAVVVVVLLFIFNPSKQKHVEKLADYEVGKYTQNELALEIADEWIDDQVKYHNWWLFSYTTQKVGRSNNIVSFGIAGFVFCKGNLPESRASKVRKILTN